MCLMIEEVLALRGEVSLSFVQGGGLTEGVLFSGRRRGFLPGVLARAALCNRSAASHPDGR